MKYPILTPDPKRPNHYLSATYVIADELDGRLISLSVNSEYTYKGDIYTIIDIYQVPDHIMVVYTRPGKPAPVVMPAYWFACTCRR